MVACQVLEERAPVILLPFSGFIVQERARWKLAIPYYEEIAALKRTPEFQTPSGALKNAIDFLYGEPLGGGTLTLRLGRQLMAIDLQRFVSVRDGPNLRQPYDAVYADYERGAWRVTGGYTGRATSRVILTSSGTGDGDTAGLDYFSIHW